MTPSHHLLLLALVFAFLSKVGAERSVGFEPIEEISGRSFAGNVTKNLTTNSLMDCAYACVQQDKKSNNCNSFLFGELRWNLIKHHNVSGKGGEGCLLANLSSLEDPLPADDKTLPFIMAKVHIRDYECFFLFSQVGLKEKMERRCRGSSRCCR